ncbi:hypothetical protein [Nonomuraea sp. LPB2021202275-12-8]|uniref:hypothetical protein n=1 Tax=Nonomuraea sp. LPB2021202275-12-8 TaxID=3120159 RepID=UPI00300D1975
MTAHQISVRAFPVAGGQGGSIVATCSCGSWRTSQRYLGRADLPSAVRAMQALGRNHSDQKHEITITNDRHPVQGGNVWGHCSCLGWGTVQGYVRNLGQGVAERVIRLRADEHLKEITNP